MIKRKKKICVSCGRETYLFGKGLCSFCYQRNYQKQLKKSQTKPKRKKTGEKELFDRILAERGPYCQVTGDYISDIGPQNFSHILSKGAYPEHRLNSENIWIVRFDIHQLWEENPEHEIFKEKRKQRDKLKFNQL